MIAKRVGKKNEIQDNMPMYLLKRKPKNLAKNLFAALQAVIDPLENQLGYMG